MKKPLLITTCLFCLGICRAQSLAPEVIGSAGDVFSASNGSLEWTIGEIMTETYQQSNGYLTQGFHQTGQGFVGINEINVADNFSIYPNPVKDLLHLSFDSKEKGNYVIELFDMQGKKLLSQQITAGKGLQSTELNMQDIGSGVYLLNVYNTHTSTRNAFKINKLN